MKYLILFLFALPISLQSADTPNPNVDPVKADDAKPMVWIYTDMSDGTLKGPTHMGTVNDLDEISRLGTIFVEGKFVRESVDHSDAATYWVLLGNWGVGLKDIADDGTNPPAVEGANEQKFRDNSKRIHDELLRRANAAAAGRQ